jgi:hypothetical protein
VFFMILTLASIGLPTTSGFTGEFMVLLAAFVSAWPLHVAGDSYPLTMAVIAVSGVVLGALYMLRFAQAFLFGVVKAPHLPIVDLSGREKAILAAICAGVFWLGLFPNEPLQKTELAAKEYRQLVSAPRLPGSAVRTAGPPQGANYAPSGGLGAHATTAGPSQGPNHAPSGGLGAQITTAGPPQGAQHAPSAAWEVQASAAVTPKDASR